MKTIMVKFPQAKNWLEVEEVNDLVGFSRVTQLGYGKKVDLDQVEVDAPNNDLKEIVLGTLCSDNLEYTDASGYYVQLSLPGSDLWFEADGDDIMYARILLNNGYDVKMIPENMQFKVNEPEYQKIIEALSPYVKEGQWKNFVWAAWKNGYDMANGYSTLQEVEKDLKFWCNM